MPSTAIGAIDRDVAARAAIHPVSTERAMDAWLARVPQTHALPPDFEATLRTMAGSFIVEMTTEPGCLPCGNLWGTLGRLRTRYGWQIRTIGVQEAMIRSGRLGLPWVGHPVVWIRPRGDDHQTVPVAVGTDHGVNIARNVYLGMKMLSGARPSVGLRAMSKFTGIVAPTGALSTKPKRKGD